MLEQMKILRTLILASLGAVGAFADTVTFAFQPGGSLTGNLLTGVAVAGVNATASHTSPGLPTVPIAAGVTAKSTGIASSNSVVPNVVGFALYLPGSPLTVGGTNAGAVSSTLQFLSAVPFVGAPITTSGTYTLIINTPTVALDPTLASALGVQASATGVSATLVFSGTYNFATGAVNGTLTSGQWVVNAAPSTGAVPEPTTSALMAIGIAGIAVGVKRRKANKR
jgi:hypothetical protein